MDPRARGASILARVAGDLRAPEALETPDLSLRGRFEPGQALRYALVPFEVPAGVRQLHVRYDYSDRIPSDPAVRGGNTLDIGLFDSRGYGPGSPGFRGWSGSNKRAFTVDQDWATPPYRRGALPRGTWHVLLGPYKIGPSGLDYRVDIWLNAGLPPEAATLRFSGPPPASAAPPAAESGWVRGELHCHTVYSDGDAWPAEALHVAAASGLDFIAITDHNGIGAHVDPDALPPDTAAWPLVVPGVEVTTYRGHWNAWGLPRWFEFRDPTAAGVARAVAEAVEAGAVVSVSHPRPLGPPWEYEGIRGYHAVEVWNGPWARMNSVALAWWEAHLARGERPVAVGGSDTHQIEPRPGTLSPPRIGTPTNWLRLEAGECRSAAAILRALRRGDGFLSASPAGPQLYLRPHAAGAHVRIVGAAGAALLLVGEEGCVAGAAVTSGDWEHTCALPPGTQWVRAQVVDRGGAVLALSNPLWRE